MSEQEKRIRQIAGVAAIEAAIESAADVRLLMYREDAPPAEIGALLELAKRRDISVRSATPNVIARLSAVDPPAPALALVGRNPTADIEGMLAARGACWLMVGVAYPGNIGMVIRTAEVSGGEGIVVDADFEGDARKAALRAGMRADKFMPVHWAPAASLLEPARRTGHRVFALDEAAERLHYEADLTGPCVFVVGGENGGIPAEVLGRCDERIRVPMAGFIPCYNLQAAVSAIATERLRQEAAG
ncbi:MAG: hypothetical protein GY725_10710 [bacterium]|nr:hypothetical protein [bacterium]